MSDSNKRAFPGTRMRRTRSQAWMRALVAEHHISPQDFIYPMFVEDSSIARQPILSMPGIDRLNADELLREAEQCCELGIPAIALFPNISDDKKTEDGSEAWRSEGLIPSLIRNLKTHFPQLGVIADVALDPFTSHGQDGLIDADGRILNDATNACLLKQALCYAEAGVDVLAPSDMMDGRIGIIRTALEANHFHDTAILSYAAKYASSFYGPFREAVGSGKKLAGADKMTYQMNPANSDEALQEVALDLQEGADMVMVKPGGYYLDIVQRVKERFGVPTMVYQVSGEYSMIKTACATYGWDTRAMALESLLACKRAGACAVLTYFAIDAARWLNA